MHEAEDDILSAIQRIVNGTDEAGEFDVPPALSADSRNLIALAAAIAHRREADVIESCVRRALASGATSEAVVQVVSLATQMAELPAASYMCAAHRAIDMFGAGGVESSK